MINYKLYMLIYSLRTRPGRILLATVGLELTLISASLIHPFGVGPLEPIIAASFVSLFAVAAWLHVEDRVGELGLIGLVAFMCAAVGSPMLVAGLA